MNSLNFVAVILKVLLVNLLAALNFANVFFINKKRLENKKNVKKRKDVTKIKRRKNVLHLCCQVRGCDVEHARAFLLAFCRPSVAASTNYNVFSERHATDRQTDGWTDSSPHCCVRVGASNPRQLWVGNQPPPHIRPAR